MMRSKTTNPTSPPSPSLPPWGFKAQQPLQCLWQPLKIIFLIDISKFLKLKTHLWLLYRHNAEIYTCINQHRHICHVPSSMLYHSLILNYQNSQLHCISGESGHQFHRLISRLKHCSQIWYSDFWPKRKMGEVLILKEILWLVVEPLQKCT